MSFSRRGGASGAPVALCLLLILPPAANLLHREAGGLLRDGEGGEKSATDLEADLATHRNRNARLEQELLVLRRQVQILEQWSREKPDFIPRLLRVLPIQDPSTRRHSIWISGGGLGESAAVVSGSALVGRVDATFAGQAFARVQTLLDRHFRVRFRCGDLWGFLEGTGEVDRDGHPLLKILLQSADVTLQEGQRVFTDGNDGVYPEGLLIGEMAHRRERSSDAHLQVRAAVHPDTLRDVVILVDRITEAAVEAIEEERS